MPQGPFAYVLSLTDWDQRGFEGGETSLLQPRTLDYWRGFDSSRGLEVGDLLMEVEPEFNRLLCFDARVPHGPDVAGMQDLKKHILTERKDDVVENLIRRLLSYGLGRELTYRDRYAVEAILEASNKNEYKLQDTIRLICQSKAFIGN